MKWFKHYADNHRGKSVQFLFDQFGHLGVSSYYILLEMCAEKLEQRSDRSLTEVDLVFGFHQRVVRQNLRTTPTKVRELLECCQTLGLLSFEITQDLVEIKMPILLNLLESDQKKPRLNRVTSAIKSRLDKDKEEERDKIKNKNIPKAKNEIDKTLNSQIWEAYKNAYFDRYQVDPTRNAATNAKISQIAKRLGADSISVVEFYVKHNDSFYLKNLHSIGHCLSNAESLHTQWKRNQPVTSRDVKFFEKNVGLLEVQKHIDEGKDF